MARAFYKLNVDLTVLLRRNLWVLDGLFVLRHFSFLASRWKFFFYFYLPSFLGTWTRKKTEGRIRKRRDKAHHKVVLNEKLPQSYKTDMSSCLPSISQGRLSFHLYPSFQLHSFCLLHENERKKAQFSVDKISV